MVYRPEFKNIHRIDPIGREDREEQKDDRKRRVLYQGRTWKETEEDIPISPPQEQKRPQKRMFYESKQIEQARSLLQHMTTVEEKIGQLFFIECEASYDIELGREVELLIQTWEIGGLLFQKGEYKRQVYLIEKFQEISKTPLLIGNSFSQGLSFYLQGDTLDWEKGEGHFVDLGKAVMTLNRQLGIYIQFDHDQAGKKEKHSAAFQKGISEAHGILGTFESESLKHEGFKSPEMHVKSLSFYSIPASENLETEMLEWLTGHYDAFICSNESLVFAIKTFSKLVKEGKITIAELEKRVLKLLLIKAFINS